MILDDIALSAELAALPTSWEHVDDQRPAAVLAPIFAREGEDWLLFTERRADLPLHPGQISFPGGAREADEDPVACARRESAEEVGLQTESVELLGALPNHTSTSLFRVHTIVGRIGDPENLKPNPREVASIFAVPFAELLVDDRWEEREYDTTVRRYGPSPHFVHERHLIWGLTGRLTRELLAAVGRSEV
jgi:8-oxo-dGTP pyrophosphatase MutT (NUDIX family)